VGQDITFRVLKETGVNALNDAFQHLHLIDSSTISLCLSDYPWADFRKTTAGVKLHLGLRFFEKGVLPEKVVITPAKLADNRTVRSLRNCCMSFMQQFYFGKLRKTIVIFCLYCQNVCHDTIQSSCYYELAFILLLLF